MKILNRLIARLLILSMVLVPFSVQAGMISTERVVASAATQSDRVKIVDFIARADVQKQMEVLGLSPASAMERVAALTDEEVQRVAGRINSVPAGASSAGVAWTTLFVLVLMAAAYIYWK